MLCLTGSEALYADMGHFGRGPIAAAWFCLVFPCLVLQYTGQSAFLLKNIATLQPDAVDGAQCAAVWYRGGACTDLTVPASCCTRYTAAQSLVGLSFWAGMPNYASYTASAHLFNAGWFALTQPPARLNLPVLVVATLASIVGSQSVITGSCVAAL